MFKKIALSVVILLSLVLVIGSCNNETLTTPQASGEVVFSDSNLEASVRKTINKPEGTILASDLKALAMLEAIDQGITDLSGLEYCTGLTNLLLDQNQITDLSPLASLGKLSGLSLKSNRISDLTPLSSLKNLGLLDLNFNKVTDISPLASLTNLHTLNLAGSENGNKIIDLSALASMISLRSVWLANNQIGDISPLLSLENLKTVNLDANPLSDDSINKYIPELEGKGIQVHAKYLLPNK